MKKILSVLLAVLFCLGVCPVFASAANEDIIASIKGGAAQIGGTITVPVFLDVNKGFVTLGIMVSYDSDVLEIVCENHKEGGNSCSPSIEKANFASGNQGFNSQFHTNNPYRFQWAYATITKDICETGQIASITFKVKNTAKLGNTKVSVKIDQASCYTKKPRTFAGGEANIRLVCANHISNEGKVTKNPTCTEKGVKTYLCNICNEVAKTEDIPSIGHSFGEWAKTKEPTCTVAGEETRVCSNDTTHKEVKEIKALGHNFGEWAKTKEPTCTEKGEETRVCRNDATHKEAKEIKALGHSFGEWTKTKEPTCTAEGEETRICAKDATHKETRKLDKLRHTVAWQILKEPTVTSEGKRTGKCSVCGNSVTETMPKLTTTLEGDKLGLITDTEKEQKPADGFKVDSTKEETFSGYVKGEIKETIPKSPITIGSKTVAAIYDIVLRDADNGKTISGERVVVLTIPVKEAIRSNYDNIVLAGVDANGKYVVIEGAKLSDNKFVVSGKYASLSKLLIAGDKIAKEDEPANTESNIESNLDSENNTSSVESPIEQDNEENPPVKKKNTTVWAIAVAGLLAVAFVLVFLSMRKRF